MDLANTIEAILFYQAEPLTVSRLAQLLKRTEGDVHDALNILEERLQSTGIRLLRNDRSVTIGTSPDASAIIEAITKEELSKDLSKSALETLSIVLYKGPLTRSEIDYIRGVNSTFILRNLLIRGLVEKVENPNDQRSFHYKATFALLEYMGVTKADELPEYKETLATLAAFIETKAAEEKEAAAESEGKETREEHTDANEDAALVAGFDTDVDEEEEADISEEDAAGANFDDDTLKAEREHREEDPLP